MKLFSYLADAILRKGTTKVLKKSILPVRSETKFPNLYSITMFLSCDFDVRYPPCFSKLNTHSRIQEVANYSEIKKNLEI